MGFDLVRMNKSTFDTDDRRFLTVCWETPSLNEQKGKAGDVRSNRVGLLRIMYI